MRTVTVQIAYVDPPVAGYAPLSGAIQLTPAQAATLRSVNAGFVANNALIGAAANDPLGGTIKALLDAIAAAAS